MLPLVLWTCAVLALLVAGLLHSAHTAAMLAHQRAETLRARSAADAGVAFALLGLLGAAPGEPWPRDGRITSLQLSAATVAVSAQDELGLLDVNAAAAETLARLFEALGAQPRESRAAARAVAAFRAPPDRPPRLIAGLEQLANLPGLPPSLYERARRYLTVRTGTTAVDPVTAPLPVLRSLPGMAVTLVDAMVQARATAEAMPGTLPLLNDVGLQGAPLRHFAVIRAEGGTASGAHFLREAEVELHPGDTPAYDVLSWRQSTQ